jgi:transcriptional antiterminator RfaH
LSWIIIYTKSRQEERAKEHLETLGLEVSLPRRPIEKIKDGAISITSEPLFPRYIFIRNDLSVMQKVSYMLRNVRGVSQIVKFGGKFAELDATTFAQISNYENALSSRPAKAYQSGDNVVFTYGAFRDIQAVYEEADGDKRVILLFDLLSKSVRLSVPVSALKRG